MSRRFARPCAACGARVPAGGSCPVCAAGGRRAGVCRVCGRRTDGGAYCSEHSAEIERLERQPWRAEYASPEYARNRAARFKLAGGRCEDCGASLGKSWECDHVVPLRDGGTNLVDNLRARCLRCHRAKTRADRATRRRRA